MRMKVLALAVCAAAGAAQAAEPQPQRAVPGGPIAAAKAQSRPMATVLPSPTIMETTAVRMPDGTVQLVCEPRRNPNPRLVGPNKPFPEPQQ